MQDARISIRQMRSAMRFLNWTAADMARVSGASVDYIRRQCANKAGYLDGRPDSVAKISSAFSRARIVFENGAFRRMDIAKAS